MPITTNHSNFKQPQNIHSPVWRYMSLAKFLSLLHTQSIFLSRVDLLDDPFEGSSTNMNITLRQELYKDKIPPDQLEKFSQYFKHFRRWSYVNCWHLSTTESSAMWKLYGSIDGAVAIQSTYNALVNAVDVEGLGSKSCYIGMVEYISEEHFVTEGNSLGRFMVKRNSFEHEKEVRILLQKVPEICVDGKKSVDIFSDNPLRGISLPVNLKALIQKIYISPLTGKWFFESVEDLLRRYDLDMPIEFSMFAQEPVY